MKLKILFMVLVFALASFAQTATPAAPSTAAPDAKTCACCNHGQAASDAKPGCCQDGKCPMMSGSKDGKKCPMMSGDKTGMKCPMMAKNSNSADGKTCCSSNKCPMHEKGAKSGCCCGNMDQQKPAGI